MKNLQKNIQMLATIFARTKSKALMADLLEDLLTPAEINAVSERLNVLLMLKQGHVQRDISKKLKCSISTVTRGSRILQFGNQSVGKVMKNI